MKACRNCGSTEMYQSAIYIQARRPGAIYTTWPFQLQACAKCGLSDIYFPEDQLDWVKAEMSPINKPPEQAPNSR